MNETQEQLGQAKKHLRDIQWDLTPPLEARPIIASEFEAFILALMTAHKISAEDAQSLASSFVEIFKPATSYPAFDTALITLKTSGKLPLIQFALKLEEVKLSSTRQALYQSLVTFVHEHPSDLGIVHSLAGDFEKQRLTTRAAVTSAIGKAEIKSQVDSLAMQLEQAGFQTQAQDLRRGYNENRVTNTADLQSWQDLLNTKKTLTPKLFTTPNTSQPAATANKLWAGIMAFDKSLRDLWAGKKNRPHN